MHSGNMVGSTQGLVRMAWRVATDGSAQQEHGRVVYLGAVNQAPSVPPLYGTVTARQECPRTDRTGPEGGGRRCAFSQSSGNMVGVLTHIKLL